jgi:hypothetical protein
MGNPFHMTPDPVSAPDPVTPAASYPSPTEVGGPEVIPGMEAGLAAASAASLTPEGRGPAPYDISGPQDIAGISAAVDAAGALSGAGVVYGAGPRQAEAAAILYSAQGAESSNVFAGFPDYENADLRPDTDLNTPIQGQMGTYPESNTYQPGLPMFTGREGAGVEGVPPEGGSMDTPGGNYPGTTQDGLTKYGTS